MAADKRATLLSDLLAAKGAAAGDAGKPAEPERAAVIQIAKRRPSEDRASEAPTAPSMLYSKGAATASTFRPSYWSFDHDEAAETESASAKAEPAPPPTAPPAHASRSRPLPINFVVAFGCVALFVSTTLFVLSQQHRADAEAPPQLPSAMAAAPAPPPAPTVAAISPPAEPAPAVAPPAPAAQRSVPGAPAPGAGDPAPGASAAIAAKLPVPADSPPVTAAPPPVSSADTEQADALLARGDDLMATGDVVAARLYYQRSAELGSSAAATAVGQTYDPGVLELLRVRGARGDVQLAAEWYRKAIAAGDRQAEIRLKRLLARQTG